jgi:hypothetical protein
VFKRRHSRPRNVAADEGRDCPHHHGNGDDDGGENDHPLQNRRVQPDAVVTVVVVFAHHIRPKFLQRTGWWSTSAKARLSAAHLSLALYAAAFFNFSATLAAKYVSTPSAPARLKAIRLSIIALSPSSQPLPAAAMIIAYSPDT